MSSENSADVLIIGGGAAGCSVAMQLALRKLRVIVLERASLGSGSTGRAAGLVGQLRSNSRETLLLKKGLEVVQNLEAQSDTKLFEKTGSLHVASTESRAEEIRAFVKMGKSIDFEIDLVDSAEASRLLPCMKTDDLIEIAYCPSDGHFQPAELLAAYVKTARKEGAVFKINTPFEKPIIQGGRIQGVHAGGQNYYAPVVVNAAGPWSSLVGRKTETSVPTATLGHFYLIARPIDGIPIGSHDAAIRDRENRIYTRPEVGGILIGTYEAEPIEYDMEKFPPDFDMSNMKPERDSLNVAMLIDNASKRFPFINERTPMTVTHGIMTFTPDGFPLCGPADELEGLFHCTGFCGRGVFQSTCIGLVMADLITKGSTEYDIDHIISNRFKNDQSLINPETVQVKCRERYSGHYGVWKK